MMTIDHDVIRTIDKDVIVCKYCGKEIQPKDLFCRYCGHNDSYQMRVTVRELKSIAKCASCKEEVDSDDNFCHHCGSRFIGVRHSYLNVNPVGGFKYEKN